MTSSSPSSSSVTAAADAQLLSSSSSPPPPLSLRSPELQAEFLQECGNKIRSHCDVASFVTSPSSPLSSPFSPSPSSPLSSPFSPSPSSPLSSPCSSSSPSPSSDNRRARLSLSSPELLSELKESRTRQLRHVPAHNGLTTVFCGRGRGQASGSASSARSANQRTPH